MKKKEHFITIHSWMIQNYDLKGLELLLYAIIYGFTIGKDVGYYGSRRTLAEMTNSTRNGVDKALNNLIKKKLVRKEYLIRRKKSQPVYLALEPEVINLYSSNNLAKESRENLTCIKKNSNQVETECFCQYSDINDPILKKGLFENVILTQELLERLEIEAPEHFEAYIKRLDIHIEKSHRKSKFKEYTPYQFYLTILDWLERDGIIDDPGLL